jgi:hypothetical protein
MKLGLQLAAFVLLTSTASFGAETWRGYLIDSKCYEIEEQNVPAWYTLGSAGRDKDLEIKMCAPTPKTKSFGVVLRNWELLRFDPGGNAKASEFIRNSGNKQVYLVEVTGEMEKKALKVDAIAPIASSSPEPAEKGKTK